MRSTRTMVAIAATMLAAVPAAAQTLVDVRAQDAPNFDPQNNTLAGMGHPMYQLGDTLLAMGWDLKSVHPLLAKSWSVSADGRTYTFKLRDDVTFCSGKKFTAADVVYTFTRLTDVQVKKPFAWRAGRIKEVRAVDPYTVEYELEEPYSELPMQLTNFGMTIINKDNVEALGKDYGVKGFDGTGPMCFEFWEPRNQAVLRRHDAYRWGPTEVYQNAGPVKYEKFIWKVISEDWTRVAALASGQADFCHWVPTWAVDQLKKTPSVTVIEPPAFNSTFYFGFKITREQVSDVKVREAFNYAVNRADILQAVYFGVGDPALDYMRPETLDFDPKVEALRTPYDPEKAKALLEEAGWKAGPDGFRSKDGKRLKPLLYAYTVGQGPKLAEAVQGYLRKVGVDLEIAVWDPTIYFSKLGTQEYDLWAISYPYTSAGDGLSLYFHSKNRPQPNRMSYADEITDRLIDGGKAALTPEDRARSFMEAQQRVVSARLWMPLVHERLPVVVSKRVKNMRAHGNYGSAIYKGLDISL